MAYGSARIVNPGDSSSSSSSTTSTSVSANKNSGSPSSSVSQTSSSGVRVVEADSSSLSSQVRTASGDAVRSAQNAGLGKKEVIQARDAAKESVLASAVSIVASGGSGASRIESELVAGGGMSLLVDAHRMGLVSVEGGVRINAQKGGEVSIGSVSITDKVLGPLREKLTQPGYDIRTPPGYWESLMGIPTPSFGPIKQPHENPNHRTDLRDQALSDIKYYLPDNRGGELVAKATEWVLTPSEKTVFGFISETTIKTTAKIGGAFGISDEKIMTAESLSMDEAKELENRTIAYMPSDIELMIRAINQPKRAMDKTIDSTLSAVYGEPLDVAAKMEHDMEFGLPRQRLVGNLVKSFDWWSEIIEEGGYQLQEEIEPIIYEKAKKYGIPIPSDDIHNTLSFIRGGTVNNISDSLSVPAFVVRTGWVGGIYLKDNDPTTHYDDAIYWAAGQMIGGTIRQFVDEPYTAAGEIIIPIGYKTSKSNMKQMKVDKGIKINEQNGGKRQFSTDDIFREIIGSFEYPSIPDTSYFENTEIHRTQADVVKEIMPQPNTKNRSNFELENYGEEVMNLQNFVSTYETFSTDRSNAHINSNINKKQESRKQNTSFFEYGEHFPINRNGYYFNPSGSTRKKQSKGKPPGNNIENIWRDF